MAVKECKNHAYIYIASVHHRVVNRNHINNRKQYLQVVVGNLTPNRTRNTNQENLILLGLLHP